MIVGRCQTVEDFQTGSETLRQRRYGVIECSAGRLVAVRLRLWPKWIAWPEVWPTHGRYHLRGQPDRCLLYYNQPWRYPNFVALKYVVSSHGTSYATIHAALKTLDEVARLKQTDALLCDAANSRISDRLMCRFGWEPHKPQRWHRNYIKRFYGHYPDTVAAQCEQVPVRRAHC